MTAFIRAAHFYAGRISTVDLLVVHTAESAPGTTAEQLGHYFATTDREASAHYGVSDVDECQYVSYDDTAWAAPGANADGEQIEMLGTAKWGVLDWAQHPNLLERTARWLSVRAKVRGIPLTFVDAAGLRANRRGVTRHIDVTNAFHRSTHTDPGLAFPIDKVLKRAAAIQGVPPVTPPAPARQTPAFPLPAGHWFGEMNPNPRNHSGANPGDRPAVMALQRRLRQLGEPIAIDGRFGPRSRAAVVHQQQLRHVAVDGLAGPATWAALWR